MPQYARPNADTHIGNYEDELGGTSNIYQSINEAAFDDSDYITSEFNPSSSPYVCALSPVTDPNLSTGHIVRFRTRKDPATGAQVDLDVELREGYVSEGSPGTLIASTSITNLPSAFTQYNFTLTPTEANSITDYTDLFLRFIANKP